MQVGQGEVPKPLTSSRTRVTSWQDHPHFQQLAAGLPHLLIQPPDLDRVEELPLPLTFCISQLSTSMFVE